jgi:predicted metal-dependent peptidase
MTGDLRATRAIQRMVEFAPSTGGLALWMKHVDLPSSANEATIYTDGTTIFYGAAFEHLGLEQQSGLIAHHVLHVALRHPQRYLELNAVLGDADLKLYNICADAIVNSALSHLTWLALPQGAIFLDKLLSSVLGIDQAIETSLMEWDVERLYRAIDEVEKAGKPGRKGTQPDRDDHEKQAASGPGKKSFSGEQSFDSSSPKARKEGAKIVGTKAIAANTQIDLQPAPQPDTPEFEAEQSRLWSERIERAHAGDGTHSMLRTLLADLPRVKTPWEQILRVNLARSLSAKAGVSWSRPARSYLANQGRSGPHRRLPWEPGASMVKPCPRLVIIVDVSGSISDQLLERFAVEIESITRRLEAELTLIIGDVSVRRVARFKPGISDLRDITFNGRGGTDFTPLLQEADKHRPDIAIVLTDLDGPINFYPRWLAIWAVPETFPMPRQPFGRLITLR